MEDPFEISMQGLAFGEEVSSEKDSRDISSAPGETETAEDSLNERAIVFREGKYEHTSQSTLWFVFYLYLSLVFFYLSLPYIFHFSRLH